MVRHMDCTLPIFQAYFQNFRFLIRRLVESGEDINKTSETGDTVLHRPRLYNLSDIQFLLDLGADVNGKNERGQTMLHRFVLFRDRQKLLDWMEQPGVDINAVQYDGVTILHLVVQWEWTQIGDILNIILGRQDLNVNAMDVSGRTALTMAIHWGKEFATRSLLNCPRINTNTAGEGENPLTNAASQCWTEILMTLLRGIDNIDEFVDESGRTVLHWTIINNMIEPLQLILTSKSFLVNRPDNRMMTALHYAAEEGLPTVTRLLLEKGATPTVRNRLNETPFHVAAAEGSKWVHEALLERSPRASINDRDRFGWTPTHRAVTSGNEELMKYLANLPGVDLTVRDKHGRSVLAFVAAYGTPEMLEMLLKTTSRDSSQEIDHFGNTLLHLAAREQNLSTTAFLLGHLNKSERNQLNFRSQTASDVVDLDTEITWILESKGVRSNCPRKPATSIYQPRVDENCTMDPSTMQLACLRVVNSPDCSDDEDYDLN
jgi:ankyrin repeat protein